ncbi:nitroreductase family protein [Salinithrix halophila]|uniref:Nitroreductase family protein n=1 Tax=Salinithrix halophila TaxID=1485204 RepID=A0ABV8JJ98_9BACL
MSSTQQDFFTVIQERHSVKVYDSNATMSEQEITDLLEMAIKAPSSWNLQHWKFLAIHDPAEKEKLLPIAYNQQQVVQASVVIAVLGDLEANKNAEAVFSSDVEAGILTEQVKSGIIDQIEKAYTQPQLARDEAIRNASLAAMQLMLAAKAQGYDTCPMGGYNAARLIDAFSIPSRYLPVMLIAVGKAAKPARQTPRFPVDDIVVWNRF